MTSVKPSRADPLPQGPHSSECRSPQEIREILLTDLSPSERKQCRDLEEIYRLHSVKRNKEFEQCIAEAFTSPLYSNRSKAYFAALFVHSDLVLRFGDEFLSEEIIVSYLKWSGARLLNQSHVKAIMESSHLSERIIETAFKELNYTKASWTLELVPDVMVTPRVISLWKASAAGPVSPYLVHRGRTRPPLADSLAVAASRVRKAHPEYESFPDDWVLKVFCGE